ncbi:MAG: hypothetical protein M5R36_12770 [Deltaproteobacteria bacterium]|nr:hypothetical protein [Deltaproteobacteria bacterium]
MRTMLRVRVPVEAGNKAIQDGSLPKIIQATVEKLKPEAAYFFPENGVRTAMFVFDMKDTSEIPQLAESFFMGLNASVEFFPVMNGDDLQKGLGSLASNK